MKSGKIIDENKQHAVVLTEDGKELILNWKHVVGLNVEDFQKGVIEFADQCKTHKPTRAVIDARKLDPNSAALAWVSAQKKVAAEEEYGPWWTREIMPIYHDAGISSLAVATGDPNSPGEVADVPPGVNFKMGYFVDLESAMQWEIG